MRKCINVKEKCANMYVTVNPQNLKTLTCNIQNRHWSLFVKFSTTRFLVKYRLRADTRVTMGGDVPFCASGSGRLQINPFAHFLSNRTYHLHPHQQLCIFTNMCMVGVWLWLFILTDMQWCLTVVYSEMSLVVKAAERFSRVYILFAEASVPIFSPVLNASSFLPFAEFAIV